MIIIQFTLDVFAVMSINCVDNKLITIIPIPTKIEEKLLLYFISLTPFASMLKGILKIDTQKEKILICTSNAHLTMLKKTLTNM